MATFRARKLARKMNGPFQRTAVKISRENVLKKESSYGIVDAKKCHSSLGVTVKACYRRGVLSSSVCSPKSSLIVVIIAMHSLSTFINISNGHREPLIFRT